MDASAVLEVAGAATAGGAATGGVMWYAVQTIKKDVAMLTKQANESRERVFRMETDISNAKIYAANDRAAVAALAAEVKEMKENSTRHYERMEGYLRKLTD